MLSAAIMIAMTTPPCCNDQLQRSLTDLKCHWNSHGYHHIIPMVITILTPWSSPYQPHGQHHGKLRAILGTQCKTSCGAHGHHHAHKRCVVITTALLTRRGPKARRPHHQTSGRRSPSRASSSCSRAPAPERTAPSHACFPSAAAAKTR